MKKLLVILSLSFATFGFSQNTDENLKIKAQDRVETIKKDYKITAEEEKQLLEIHLKIQKIANDGKISQTSQAKKIEDLKSKEEAILSKVKNR